MKGGQIKANSGIWRSTKKDIWGVPIIDLSWEEIELLFARVQCRREVEKELESKVIKAQRSLP